MSFVMTAAVMLSVVFAELAVAEIIAENISPMTPTGSTASLTRMYAPSVSRPVSPGSMTWYAIGGSIQIIGATR